MTYVRENNGGERDVSRSGGLSPHAERTRRRNRPDRRQASLLPFATSSCSPTVTVPLGGTRGLGERTSRSRGGERILFATAQKRPDVVDPQKEDLYRWGTVVRVLQLFRLPDGTMRVSGEGCTRARATVLVPPTTT